MTRLIPYRRFYGAILAIAAFALAATTIVRVKERADEIATTTRVGSDFASLIADHVEDASRTIDLSLREVIAHFLDQGSRESYLAAAGSLAFYQHLVAVKSALPQAEVIAATDADGKIVASTRGFPHPEMDLSDRDFFAHLKNTAERDLFISRPVRSTTTGGWNVHFVRRLQTPAGEFLGALIIGVNPELLVLTHQSVSNLDGRNFLLLRKDGVVLVSKPGPFDNAGASTPVESEWRRLVDAGGGSYRSPAYVDGEPSYVAVRPVKAFPLVVNVAVAEKTALAAWRRRTEIVVTLMGAGIIVLTAFTWILSRQHRLMEASDRDLRERERELADANERLEAALDNMSQGLAMFDQAGNLVISNRLFAEMYGLKPSQMKPGLTIGEIFEMRIRAGHYAGGSPERYRSLVGSLAHVDRLDHLNDGRVIALKRLPIASSGAWLTTHEDVTEQIRTSERISHLAMHDALTGLANRAQFISALSDVMQGPVDPVDCTALLLVDLDGFKGINDAFGHGVGDELLRQLAGRLCATAPLDLVARLGGDEFAILHKCSGNDCCEGPALAEALMREVEKPFFIGPRKLTVTLSVGIATLDPKFRDVERMMRWADLALYRAKREGRNRHSTFSLEMETEFQAQSDLAEELREAVEKGQLEVFYQPIIDAVTTEVRTMEALVRWRHPVRGMTPPAVFIPLAEEAGLIPALGDFVMRRACADALHWPARVSVAVNASPLQIAQGDFVNAVADALAATGLPSHRLEIEITESVLLRHDDHNIRVLHDLRELGVSIALDDFGTGYSSLSYLKIFPFDKVKIDKSFVDDVVTHAGCAAIIGATTMLARSFEITTCAEGVETEEQSMALRAAGVALMQGYHFARPRPFSDWVVSNGRLQLPAAGAKTTQAA